MESLLVQCDYYNCNNIDKKEYMEKIGYDYYVCKECIDKVEDRTGYCSSSCMCGYGCDGSC